MVGNRKRKGDGAVHITPGHTALAHLGTKVSGSSVEARQKTPPSVGDMADLTGALTARVQCAHLPASPTSAAALSLLLNVCPY